VVSQHTHRAGVMRPAKLDQHDRRARFNVEGAFAALHLCGGGEDGAHGVTKSKTVWFDSLIKCVGKTNGLGVGLKFKAQRVLIDVG